MEDERVSKEPSVWRAVSGNSPDGQNTASLQVLLYLRTQSPTDNDQIWENTASEELIRKIWGVVGFEGISNETRQKRKRTPKRRRQLHLLTLRKRLPLPFWTVQLQRTRIIPGRNNVPNGHTDSVSSNLLLTLFFGKMRLCFWLVVEWINIVLNLNILNRKSL